LIAIRNEAGFDFGSAEYRAFFARCGLTPFQHPDWLGAFYQRLPGPAGCQPLILVGRHEASGEIACVVPLLRDDSTALPRVTFAFLGVTDYACPVFDPAVFDELRLAEALDRMVGRHVLDIAPIHHDHLSLWEKLLGLRGAPMEYGSHAVAVSQPVAEWRRGSYGPNQFHGLPRKARRLAERGELRLETLSGSEARAAIDQAAGFRRGRFPGDPLQVEVSARFYGDVAASVNGLARTFRLSSDGQTAAVMFGLVHHRRFHYVILAGDYGAFGRYSPGLLIMDLAIEAWVEQGGEVFDFTIGDEPFKSAFGCFRTPMSAIRTGGE
jgi:CelD/BcsL family acetyltransferase involved in cellulose biosynthesis